MRKIFWFVLVALTMIDASWAQTGTVQVYFNPSIITVHKGNTFTVDLMANIPDPVVAWELNVGFDTSLIDGPEDGLEWVVSRPPWNAHIIITPTPTYLYGQVDGNLICPWNGATVSGNGIKLATLTFKALQSGITELIASANLPPWWSPVRPLGFQLVPDSPCPPFGSVDPDDYVDKDHVTFQKGKVVIYGITDRGPAISPLGLVILAGLLGLVGVGMRRRKG